MKNSHTHCFELHNFEHRLSLIEKDDSCSRAFVSLCPVGGDEEALDAVGMTKGESPKLAPTSAS